MDIIQFALSESGAGMAGLFFIGGIALFVLGAFGTWARSKLSKNWRIIFIILSIIFVGFSLCCANIRATYAPVATEQVAQDVPNYEPQKTDNKNLTNSEMIDYFFTIMIISILPIGAFLILL